jgi:hypothetical protein
MVTPWAVILMTSQPAGLPTPPRRSAPNSIARRSRGWIPHNLRSASPRKSVSHLAPTVPGVLPANCTVTGRDPTTELTVNRALEGGAAGAGYPLASAGATEPTPVRGSNTYILCRPNGAGDCTPDVDAFTKYAPTVIFATADTCAYPCASVVAAGEVKDAGAPELR